ncbi:reverse transcriptase [Shewanella sp. 1_MG-2023]|uniref:reverse transcriptase n=1 Tax=unclassified Shewanella TaxID=196818 RepID=UPI0026E1D8DC|nr:MULTISPECIES: reverse transcriptase [unclassified Shewanella]MDO6612276.1 reverse transcriptase [Shewanella sp. 7_MG-2023]MDO6772130.1 reverse transcriptase [Shewanella sp. 2_MG-2023]MDO6794036.1 reverse transcriptase [Shewanella sp. 1_MG-2023]
MTTTLNAITFKAQTHPRHRFQNLYGLLNTDSLYQSWGQLNKQAKPGIDGITMPNYKAKLTENIERLGQQLKQKCYRVNDIKRLFIPKSNGKLRPLGLPTVDDKLVQQSVSQILKASGNKTFCVIAMVIVRIKVPIKQYIV